MERWGENRRLAGKQSWTNKALSSPGRGLRVVNNLVDAPKQKDYAFSDTRSKTRGLRHASAGLQGGIVFRAEGSSERSVCQASIWIGQKCEVVTGLQWVKIS